MSFSSDAKNEIMNNCSPKTTCCRKAFVLGLLFDAEVSGENLTFSTDSAVIAAFASSMVESQFAKKTTVTEEKMFGKTVFRISFSSHRAAEEVEKFCLPGYKISYDAGFKCDKCEENFLRGVFLISGSVTDPVKGYHAEFSVFDARRAGKLYDFLLEMGFEPKIINRKNRCGLYFKNSTQIEELLTHLGATHSLFALMDSKIVHGIRNDENRATNCVAKNISKSVNVSQKQTLAIYKLIDSGVLEALPEELRITAKLRIENESASLSELALMHTPPISKSGLNHRLGKIMEEAEKLSRREKRKTEGK